MTILNDCRPFSGNILMLTRLKKSYEFFPVYLMLDEFDNFHVLNVYVQPDKIAKAHPIRNAF